MSRRRRREGPMPVTSAGLMRFFEEEIKGIKVSPKVVIFSAFLLITIVILLRLIT
ncbi:MAG: preprotein translocase subunit Sec61beta [Thermoprotei archaeon]|nr:MAG: preprotein translocase subunit Sec61beta [Thermoprotei archaeon]RLF18492.1 MAG: preprotein translocase subunit Sec61beta [Thermoprotei archaeon]